MKPFSSPTLILFSALSAWGDSSFDTTDQYAWSGNAGWISFRHDRPTANNGVTLTPTYLTGLAYSANVGWINLGTDQLTVLQMICRDKDEVGLADHWEFTHFGDIDTADPNGDDDGDGFNNAYEANADTNPFKNEGNFKIVSISTEGDEEVTTGKISFIGRPTRLYKVQFSPDLGEIIPWEFLAEQEVGSPNGITSMPFKLDDTPKAFFRIVPFKPLSE